VDPGLEQAARGKLERAALDEAIVTSAGVLNGKDYRQPDAQASTRLTLPSEV